MIKCEIVKHIAVLSENEGGYAKELNIISWNDGEPKYDIRTWQGTGEDRKSLKGITLTKEEMKELIKAMVKKGE